MNIHDFLNLEQPEKYDFTQCTSSENYRELSDIDKFFAYHSPKVEGSERFKDGAEKYKELKKKGILEGIVDPDSNCRLVRDIYMFLWDEKYIYFNDLFIFGETMNSANTTLNSFVSFNEREIEKLNEFRKKFENKQNMSIRYIINRFYNNDGELKLFLNENKSLVDFLGIYHTIGNFIPFPENCNPTRGIGTTKDYWDLTMLYIYEYYEAKEISDEKTLNKIIQKICHNDEYNPNAETNLKNWLDTFGTWKNFVEKNYLTPFVNMEHENYYPKQLWEGHFSSGEPLPQEVKHCNMYFINAYEWILERGRIMVEALNNNIK